MNKYATPGCLRKLLFDFARSQRRFDYPFPTGSYPIIFRGGPSLSRKVFSFRAKMQLRRAQQLWFIGCLTAGQVAASQAESAAGAAASAGSGHEPSHPQGSDVKKLSIEQQKQMLNGLYAAFWGFKMFVAGLVICILGLHGACCLFPNYKTSDAVLHHCVM
jgi:hypothetical protein